MCHAQLAQALSNICTTAFADIRAVDYSHIVLPVGNWTMAIDILRQVRARHVAFVAVICRCLDGVLLVSAALREYARQQGHQANYDRHSCFHNCKFPNPTPT